MRLPDDWLRLAGTALMFRAALVVAFQPGAALALLFWLLLRYRVWRPAMPQLFEHDLGNPFIRQFWTDRAAVRFFSASALPWATLSAIAVASFLVLPLDAAATWPHVLFLLGLITTWHVAAAS